MRKFYLGLVLVLAGCGMGAPAYQSTTYMPPANPGGRMCVDQCSKSKEFCAQSCDLDNRTCYYTAQAAAQRDYDTYTRERFAAGEKVDMLPSDFEHATNCDAAKKKCVADCVPVYNACYHTCGGTVSVTSSCQFLCFQ